MLIEYVRVNVGEILSDAVSGVIRAVGDMADFALEHKLMTALVVLVVLFLFRPK